jgi:hypothetical protein
LPPAVIGAPDRVPVAHRRAVRAVPGADPRDILMATTIESLHVYPVKSTRGIDLQTAGIDVRGLAAIDAAGRVLAGDREWMVVDTVGRFVTQREAPRLALVSVIAGTSGIELWVPHLAPATLPAASDGPTREVTVWNHVVPAHDAGDAAAVLLSAWLDREVRLVRFDSAHRRWCHPDFAGDSGAHTAFADGYPILVVGRGSLDELNARLAARGRPAVPMNRFRPNVVVAGLPPHDEDHLAAIVCGDVVIKPVKPCVRCQITTTDQDSASVGAEPLATLSSYRLNDRFGGVTFGMNAVVVAGTGARLEAGAPVRVDYAF